MNKGAHTTRSIGSLLDDGPDERMLETSEVSPAAIMEDIADDVFARSEKLAGIPVRTFTLADQTLLSKAKSRFMVLSEAEMEVSLEVCIFLYLMQAKLPVADAIEAAYLPRLELERKAMMFATAITGASLSSAVGEIRAYMKKSKETRVEPVPMDGDKEAAPKNG